MPLEYRNTGKQEFDVLSGTLVIARIGFLGVLWTWTLFVSTGPSGFKLSGSADSLESAKRELEQYWSTWPNAAGLIEQRQRRLEK